MFYGKINATKTVGCDCHRTILKIKGFICANNFKGVIAIAPYKELQ